MQISEDDFEMPDVIPRLGRMVSASPGTDGTGDAFAGLRDDVKALTVPSDARLLACARGLETAEAARDANAVSDAVEARQSALDAIAGIHALTSVQMAGAEEGTTLAGMLSRFFRGAGS